MGEIFISHASADARRTARIAERIRQAGHSIFLDSDWDDGIAPGDAWQRTLFREMRTCDAVVFVNSASGQASTWCHCELAVATELGKRIYSIDLDRGLAPHPVLQSVHGIRLKTTLDASIQRLVDSLGSDESAGSTRLRWERGRPPYPGLAALDVADAGVFFGREDDIRELLDRVDGPLGHRDSDLIVVLGPSGAGKSSLVRAGLAARLADRRSGWAVAGPFEPGIAPLDRLISSLVTLVSGAMTDAQCRDQLLGEGLAAVGAWLADRVGFPATRVLITVDQAEQLATVTSPGRCEEFLAVLGAGLGPNSPVTAVMTARSDRLDEIQRLPVLGPMIRAPFVIAPVSRSQLAAVIEGPARRADLAFAPGLVGRLVDDAVRGSSAEAADALPFLAFTLREMYDMAAREDRTTFTEADYERVGRIVGAIMRRAEAAEALLPPDSEAILDRLLPRFVTLSEDRLPAGRPVPRERLTVAEQTIVTKLEDQRLLTGTGDTVRLAHERLITAWPRLAKAVADRRDDLVLQARIERQAQDWKHGNGELLGRDATRTASSWLTRWVEPEAVQAGVANYVRASQRALRRRRARVATALSAIVALALAASAFAVVAGIQRSNAIRQSQVAHREAAVTLSEAMAAEATNLLPTNAPLAMLVSLQAYERAPTLQAESALIQAVQQPLRGMLVANSPLTSVAFSPHGHTLAAGDSNGITLWDSTTRQRTATMDQGDQVLSVAFSPNGHTLAAGNYNGITLWDTTTGQRTATLPEGSEVYSVAFSPNGGTLAAGDHNGHISLWDTTTRQRTATLPEGRAVISVAFSPNGRTLAAGDISGHISLWDTTTRQRTATPAQGNSLYSVAFSPHGHTLATGADIGITLWDTTTGQRTATLAQGRAVLSVAFSPNGRTLAAGESGHISLWDTTTRQRTATLAQGNSLYSVAFSPDGHTLAAWDASGHIGLWDTTRRPTATLPEGSRSLRYFMHLICGKIRGNLTRKQWAIYALGQPYQKTCPAYP